jgi:sodium transport system permease protein
MRTIGIVFVKELIDTIRDRRTLIFMVVIPLLLFPALFRIMFSVQRSQEKKAKAKSLRVACVTHGNASGFVDMLRDRDDVVVVLDVPTDSVTAFIRQERLDGAFVFADDFDSEVTDLSPGRVDFYYRSTDGQNILRSRMKGLIDQYEEDLLKRRFERLDLDENIVESIDLRVHNIASMQERLGKEVGGFLPYIFIIFCFMGAMYPAIDLGAGEKERGTMETLLTAPVNRFHILVGKFGVVVLSGILSAIVSMVGLFIGFKQGEQLPPEFVDVLVKILGWGNIAMMFSLLVPLTVFFAGILLSVSLSAKTFKEAQSLISPLNVAIILPAAIAMIPGIEMNYTTALIPVLNVSLATKEIIAGTMSLPLLLVVYTSLIVLALASLYGSVWWFSRESTIFRT